MTKTSGLNLNVILPVVSGGSGGLIKHLAEVTPLWLASPRVRRVLLHAPIGLLPEIDRLGIDVRRYPLHRIGPVASRFSPALELGQNQVALNLTSRPVRLSGAPLVTMVQNVEQIQSPHYPMPFLWKLRLWALRRETLKACKEATRVIAVSMYVKERLCALGVPATKIDVIYHGGSLSTKPEVHPPACAKVLRPFIFSAGSMVPYRGFEDLIRAVAIFKEQRGTPPTVVIGGSGGGLAKPYERWARALETSLDVDEHIVWAGQLTEAEMNWCFRHAAVVVQTSRAESFCMFQVEALYSGALVISCTQPPMPEILGEAAMYYPVGDAAELASAIFRSLSMSETETARWKQAALARASMFTWDQTASQTLDSLKAASEEFARARR